MAFLNSSGTLAHPARRLDSVLVAASAALLAGLAVADRIAAWLIGEFPASALLWQIRLEFLRPVSVYYDFATLSLGTLSVPAFCGIASAVAAFIAAGALSRIRLLRGVAYHLLCGLALLLWACSLDYREGIYAPAGGPSAAYAVIGALLAMAAATQCLAIHAEYVGWDPAGSIIVRRARIALRRAQRRIDDAIATVVDSLDTASRPKQIALAPLRMLERSRFER